jgi:hypothetical protein
LHRQFKRQQFKRLKEQIEDVNIDIEDHVSLELNRFELGVNVDRSDVLAEIVSSMDDPDDVTDEDVVRVLRHIKKVNKIGGAWLTSPPFIYLIK